MSDPIGHLVDYIDKNRVNLGMVQNAKKGRLGLLTSADRQLSLPQARALLLTPAAMAPDRPRDALVEYLREVESRREELTGQVDVVFLWALVNEEKDPVPPRDLAELQFGPEAGDDHHSAVLRALFYERLHFRLAGGRFEPLTGEQVEQKQLQMEREAAHQAQVDAAVAFLKSLPPKGPPSQPAPEGLLEMLIELVVFEDEAPGAKKAKEIVSLAELGGRRQLFRLLVRLGALPPHANLPLMREQAPVVFSPRVLARCQEIDPLAVLDQDRRDLSDLYTFTIDGLYTTDFDDALSYEILPQGGCRLGVHITDAAALLLPEGPLDLEARARATTLYLPDDRVPMLPPSLSEDALSLKAGMPRPAISWLVDLDDQGRVIDYELCRSLVQVDRRFTYEEADELLESEPRLAGLLKTCDQLRQQRADQGAYFLPLPEVIVGVDEEFNVYVRRLDRDGPSREMVAETAILANQLGARYLHEHEVPALYRTQAPPHQEIEQGDPGDLYLHFRQRRLLNRVEIVTAPGRHSSLGVEPYTHVTSPIRRYLDLVVQRQLGQALSGREPVYTVKELEELAMAVQPQVKRAGRVRQARQRYWIMRWLEDRLGQVLPGLVMEYQTRRWQLLITDVMLLTTIPNRPGLRLEPGQAVGIRIDRASAFDDILRVSLALEGEE